MHRGGPYWLPPRRAPFGRRAGQPSEGAPTRTARSPRASERSRSPFTAAGRRVASFEGLSQNQNPRVLRSIPLQGTCRDGSTKGNGAADRGGGGVRGGLRANGDTPRRVVRLPTADSLCDRMERGEEEAITGRRDAFRAANSADVKARRLPTSGRRKFPSAEIFEARATLREQRESAVGRRSANPSPVPVGPKTAPHASATATPAGPSPFARNRGMSPVQAAARRDSPSGVAQVS